MRKNHCLIQTPPEGQPERRPMDGNNEDKLQTKIGPATDLNCSEKLTN